MKVLTLKIGGKTYTTGKITAFLSKEAMKINKETISLAKKGQEIQNSGELDYDIGVIDDLMNSMLELSERKAWLICELHGNKFSVDDLEKELSTEEIDAEINRIVAGISGVISKN